MLNKIKLSIKKIVVLCCVLYRVEAFISESKSAVRCTSRRIGSTLKYRGESVKTLRRWAQHSLQRQKIFSWDLVGFSNGI